MKRFEWNEDTLEYFRKNKNEIKSFIINNCDLEDGESYEELIKDLELQNLQRYQSKYK
jgi:hypothetical protein